MYVRYDYLVRCGRVNGHGERSRCAALAQDTAHPLARALVGSALADSGAALKRKAILIQLYTLH